jgi:hypothetical protein
MYKNIGVKNFAKKIDFFIEKFKKFRKIPLSFNTGKTIKFFAKIIKKSIC